MSDPLLRELIKTLPYNYTEIYVIRESEKHASNDLVYNKFYRITECQHTRDMPERMITD